MLSQYRNLQRTNPLLIDGVEDQFVATTMHFPRVQYMLPGDARTLASTNIDFPGRGIIADATNFQHLPAPGETVLLIRTPADEQTLIEKASDYDILLKTNRLKDLQLGRRTVIGPVNGWVVALAMRSD